MDKGGDKDGVGVMEREERAWKGRLCEEIGRERVDVLVVQKPPSEEAATDRRGRCTHLGTRIGGGEGGKSTMKRREGAGNHRKAGRWNQREGRRRMGRSDGLREGT